MIEKNFLIYSDFIFENEGRCECGFEFVSVDPMDAEDDDLSEDSVMVIGDSSVEYFCPICGRQLATITTLEIDEDFDAEMLDPFEEAGVPFPFDRLEEMETIYETGRLRGLEGVCEDFSP